MPKILFVCLGNICRSPMAEFVMKELVARRGLSSRYTIASAGTYGGTAGDSVHPGTKQKLAEHGISCKGKVAQKVMRKDYQEYDWIIGMEERNLQAMRGIFSGDAEGKIKKLMDFTAKGGDIEDPWYSGDFESTWQDVNAGCEGLLDMLEKPAKRKR